MDKFGVLNQVYPYGSENDFGDAIIGEYDEGELMKASLGIYIDPIKLLNMYAYIIGEEIIEDYFEKRNRYLRSEKLGDYISAIQGI